MRSIDRSKHFKQGFPPSDITLPATPGKGIHVYSQTGDEKHYLDVFRQNGPDFQITRFIPASGAATRMFKSLYAGSGSIWKGYPGEQQEMAGRANRKWKIFSGSWKSIPFMKT